MGNDRKSPVFSATEIKVVKKLKELRIKQDLMQSDIAKKAGLSQGAVALMESFKRSVRKETLDKYAAAVGTSLEALFEEFNEEPDRVLNELKVSDKILKTVKEFGQISPDAQTIYIPTRFETIRRKQNPVYAFLMPNDSMYPEIKKGDYLIIEIIEINKYTDYFKKRGVKKPVLAIIKDDKELIRFLEKGETLSPKFSSPNPEIPSINEKNPLQNWEIKGMVLMTIGIKAWDED